MIPAKHVITLLKWSTVLLVMLALLTSLVVAKLGRRVTFVTESDVNIYDRSAQGSRVIAVLPPGTEVPVIECVDSKHYIVPRVKLSESVSGYVHEGRFRIVRKGPWENSRAPITFSC